jgi:hypothetical protein
VFVVPDHATDQPVPFTPGTTMTVTPDESGALVTLELAGSDRTMLSFRCGRDRWVESALDGRGRGRAARGVPSAEPTPVVSRGGWRGSTFEADLVLIETPHRMRLRGNAGRLDATWNAAPLTGHRIETQLPT